MTKWKYLPILKWKLGESIALRNLKGNQWDGVVPLIELQPVDAAPDFNALQSKLPAYLSGIGPKMAKAFPKDTPFGLDTRYLSAGYARQCQLLTAVHKRLSKTTSRDILPVISSAMVQNEPLHIARLSEVSSQCILRIDVPSVDVAQVQPIIEHVQKALHPAIVHVVIDQFSLVGKDHAVVVPQIKPYLDKAIGSGCESVTLAGGSFPVNLIGYKQGVVDIERVEWKVWKQIRRSSAYANIRYSDYCVTHPALAPEMDPTQMNPSVAIRYAASDHWRLFKAGGFKNGAPDQYRALCNLLLGDPVYSGATFSYGDKCYDDAAHARLGNGNPSSWRRDATNHHLVLTQRAL